jgi:energy-coupling factor transporter ATP-binding protein EcfA2
MTMPDAPLVFDVRSVAKRYGAVWALHDATFGLRSGEVLGLIGDNGAGKSTLVNIIAGTLQRDRGRLLVDGVEAHYSRPSEAQALDRPDVCCGGRTAPGCAAEPVEALVDGGQRGPRLGDRGQQSRSVRAASDGAPDGGQPRCRTRSSCGSTSRPVKQAYATAVVPVTGADGE